MTILGNNFKLTLFTFFSFVCTFPAFSTTYCAFGGGYLTVGMNASDVKQLCGPPLSTSKKKTYDFRKIKVQQLFYTLKSNPEETRAFNSTSQSGSGLNLMISIVANKARSLRLDNTSTEGLSICPNGAIQVGSSLSSVISACGRPNHVNTSFQKVRQGNIIEQEIWIIKTSEYGQQLTLTFMNDILKTIQ